MYPIDCFNVNNEDKIEAVRYYIELNKTYLKEISVEEYELFIEYLQGEGKDILAKMKDAKTEKELYLYLNRIESVLPYAKNLSEHKSFDKKINAIHKELANLALRDLDSKHNISALKQQRVLAEEYDQIFEYVNKYKDCVRQYNYLKNKITDTKAIKVAFASKFGVLGINELSETIKSALESRREDLKNARKTAFDNIKEYYVKEQMYVITQERMNKQSER